MKKRMVYLSVLALIILSCDNFNAPLKEYIEEATGKAMGLNHFFSTSYYVMSSDSVVAIPPGETTVMVVSLRNPYHYDLQLALEGDGTGNAIVALNADKRTAVVTITNPNRLDVFDLTLTIEANGRLMTPYKLPKMESRYLNADLESLSVYSPPDVLLSSPFSPDALNYPVYITPTTTDIQIDAAVPAGSNTDYSMYRLISGIRTPIVSSPIPVSGLDTIYIEVIADCGKIKTYTISMSTIAARIGTTEYTYLYEAIQAATSTDANNPTVITILNNIYVPESGASVSGYTIDKHIQLVAENGVNLYIILGSEYSTMFSVNSGASLALGDSIGGRRLTLSGNNGVGTERRAVSISSGGTLIMNDNAAITAFKQSTSIGAVLVTGGSFIMNSGTITGNTALEGAGVYINNGGSFTMKGGTIEGNSAATGGGGVCINDGNFTMSGGFIYGNDWPVVSQRNTSISLFDTIYYISGTAQYAGAYGTDTIDSTSLTLP